MPFTNIIYSISFWGGGKGENSKDEKIYLEFQSYPVGSCPNKTEIHT